MTKYQDIGPEISEVVKNSLKPHLWYISDEQVGWILFLKKVFNEKKVSINKNMKCEHADRKVREDSALLTNQAVWADFFLKKIIQVV